MKILLHAFPQRFVNWDSRKEQGPGLTWNLQVGNSLAETAFRMART